LSLIYEFSGILISLDSFGEIIFAKISIPVIVLGLGLLKYDPASTAYISLFFRTIIFKFLFFIYSNKNNNRITEKYCQYETYVKNIYILLFLSKIMSNQTSKTITLNDGTTQLTASIVNKNIELSYSDGRRETVPPRQPSNEVIKKFGTDNGGIIGTPEIHNLIQSDKDDSIALAYSDMQTAGNYIVCLCDKRVGKGWQVCEDPIAELNLTIDNVELTTKNDSTDPSGWKFLMTVTGTRNQQSYREERGH
jgi:hypothetical protein